MQRELVERARGGDHEAFTQLVKAGFPRLKGVAYLVLRDVDRAEDAVQDVGRVPDGSRPSFLTALYLHRIFTP